MVENIVVSWKRPLDDGETVDIGRHSQWPQKGTPCSMASNCANEEVARWALKAENRMQNWQHRS